LKDATIDDLVFDENEFEIPGFIRKNDSFGDLVWGKGVAPFMAEKSDVRMMVHIRDTTTEVAVHSLSDVVYSKRIHANEDEVGGILQAVFTAVEQASPEQATDIMKRGIAFTGDVARLKGLDRLLREKIVKRKVE
jgi:Actin-like ATPase involved in cell morphogenesis